MEINATNLGMLSQLLEQSFSPTPSIRKKAEQDLLSAETQAGFLLLVLTLVKTEAASIHIRQSAALYFKNVVKKQWAEEEQISAFDRTTIKSQLVPIMVSLSTPSLVRLQSQMEEAVSEIAGVDFPDKWPNLIDDLVNSFSGDDFVVNNGVLSTAHSIFGRWRSKFQSNELYSTINLVMAKFAPPYFEMFKRVDSLLSLPANTPLPANCTLENITQSLYLLLELFHDFNSQDLPEFFEDNNLVFMGGGASTTGGYGELGLLGKYLRWDRPELAGEDDDEVPGPMQRIKAAICEIAELYALKYADTFPQLGLYVKGVWEIVAGLGMGVRDDQLVGKALGFLSVVVKMGSHASLFSDPATLQGFCDTMIIPNITIRPHEEEMFEDDPLEYIRRDLAPSTENDTRRQAATEFTQALMQHFEGPVTSMIGVHINRFLQEYKANPQDYWKAKDTAIYLLTSIASKGSTAHAGVTSTNSLVDIVQFFSDNVFADLQAAPGSVNAILQVDAIKYLHTFRNQLTKEQLLSVLPVLVVHLEASNYVVYSYAAITIERILFIKRENTALFNQADVQPFADKILMACFRNIQSGQTPEKIAENDYLMKCVMRTVIIGRQAVTPYYQEILTRLVAILGETSKNPSNPRFNQYNFESISALIRFTTAETPGTLTQFEGALFGPIQFMLTNDVTEFIPYAFQITSQLLELHPVDSLPDAYKPFLQPLLHASLWESRGNVPALVRIWKAMLMRGSGLVVQSGQVAPLLGIFQRLMSTKSTDAFGLDLLQSLYEFIPLASMQGFTPQVLTICLTRLQTAKTPTLSNAFSVFFLFLCAIDQVGPDFVIGQLQSIQTGLAIQILENVVLPEVQRTAVKDRKVVAVGLSKLLVASNALLTPATKSAWPQVLEAALDLFALPQDVRGQGEDQLDELDPEDNAFQASFSKLGASETTVRDPVASIADPKAYLSKGLAAQGAKQPGILPGLMSQLSEKSATPFAEYMSMKGHRIV